MEKYTIDIDKVLDDFEQTEAQKLRETRKNQTDHALETCSCDSLDIQPVTNVTEEKKELFEVSVDACKILEQECGNTVSHIANNNQNVTELLSHVLDNNIDHGLAILPHNSCIKNEDSSKVFHEVIDSKIPDSQTQYMYDDKHVISEISKDNNNIPKVSSTSLSSDVNESDSVPEVCSSERNFYISVSSETITDNASEVNTITELENNVTSTASLNGASEDCANSTSVSFRTGEIAASNSCSSEKFVSCINDLTFANADGDNSSTVNIVNINRNSSFEEHDERNRLTCINDLNDVIILKLENANLNPEAGVYKASQSVQNLSPMNEECKILEIKTVYQNDVTMASDTFLSPSAESAAKLSAADAEVSPQEGSSSSSELHPINYRPDEFLLIPVEPISDDDDDDDDSGVSSTDGQSPPEIAPRGAAMLDVYDFLIASSADYMKERAKIAEASSDDCNSLSKDQNNEEDHEVMDNMARTGIPTHSSLSNVAAYSDDNFSVTVSNPENQHSSGNTSDTDKFEKGNSTVSELNGNFVDHVKGNNSSFNDKDVDNNSVKLIGNSETVSEETANDPDFDLNVCENYYNGDLIDKTINKEKMVSEALDSSLQKSETKSNLLPRLQRPTTLDLPSRHTANSEVLNDKETLIQNQQPVNEIAESSEIVANDAKVTDCDSSLKEQQQIGIVKPFWIPDADAPKCMHCGVKFTVIKRRHHCRACGKVLCSRCCNLRAHLAYLNKEDRICHPCFQILSSTAANKAIPVDSQSSSSCGSSPSFSPSPQSQNVSFNDKNAWRPHPNNPDDYCSTIPPLQQIQLSGSKPPPTVMVPIGVLKRGNKPRREPKQVIFSDGIRPGGDLTDLTEPTEVVPVYRRVGRKRVDKLFPGEVEGTENASTASPQFHQKNRRILISDAEGSLPPIVLPFDDMVNDNLDWNQLLEKMQDEKEKPINFAVMKNMHIFVNIVKLDCCFGKECWCFTSHGLCTVGQDEVMVILERLPEENILPRGILKLFTQIYDCASKGTTFEELGHIIFPEEILGSSDHRGFLFVRPTFQCLSKLTVPNSPFLVAILIHKWEVPWAKVFPLRLMLRLGAECRYYPCSLVSVRYRKPVYFEIGQTIMSVLADLRNYQFTIPTIPGVVVHMEEKKTCVNIPRNRYEKVMKVLNSNNVEHVLALGSNFSTEADSHLVCMQKEEGEYHTQAINIENTTRRVTGASFIVFSGALKSSSGMSAKFSIVEDGLLVQIPPETMMNLHVALRDMRDLTIDCGQINAAEPEEVVIIQWTRDDKKFNIGVRSPIDGKSLEGVPSLRIHCSTDYAGENYLIRWTEVFFLEMDENGSNIQNELVDPCRLAETVAQSCCMALAPYLDQLAQIELTKLGLRVTLDAEKERVEYDIGARGKPLPGMFMNSLDSSLIPVILRLSSSSQSEQIAFELIFHILLK